jgi:putative copper export protein
MRSLLIRFAVVIVYACGPIFISGLGWGFFLISQTAPLWLFALFCFSGVVVALGLATLLDRQSPLPPRRSSDR